MKFDIDVDGVRKCAAYVDEDGGLMIRSRSGDCLYFDNEGNFSFWNRDSFDESEAVKKLYSGDTLTITL